MPTYEYRCTKCGATNLRSGMFKTTRCAHCNGRAKRVYSAPAIHFKGSGFYNTDYKGKGKKDPPKDDKPPQEVKKDADKKASTTTSKSDSA